jgi:hypothetical protein
MTGGLLQIVTSGKQDIYLTINPEITFFKKVFRRHTNFSLELKEINPEQPAEFNNMVTFILNNGDAIHRCYLEIDLPLLSFSDSYITNKDYIRKKQTDIANLTQAMTEWKNYYDNLKGFVDLEIPLYRNLYNILQTENVSINSLKDEVTMYNLINKTTKDLYKNKIDYYVFQSINISGYISSINKIITNDDPPKNNQISRLEIINQINQMYNTMVEYLNYYNNKKVEYDRRINEKSKDNQISFNYADYLGHNFFDFVRLEIGGLEVSTYYKDILHINQMHKINSDNMPNYLEMIGHTPNLNEFNNQPKGNSKILVPLIFWFNKDAGSSLPLVSLQYSEIVINAKVSDISNIICFENYAKLYDELVLITIDNVPNDNSDGYILNKNLIYDTYKYNTIDKSITYFCEFINNELLKIQFPDLTDSEINTILVNNGTEYTLNQITKILNPNMTLQEIETLNGSNGLNKQYLINKNQWIGFMINIKDPLYSSLAYKVGSYYPFINFNLYYSLINNPNIKLVAEYVYFDDVERAKFANSKLEYVVEVLNQDIFTIRNQDYFDCELSFNNPSKEIMWYIQPQIYLDGISEYGPNTSLLFDTYKYFSAYPINRQKLTFNQLDAIFNNVDFNYWTYMNSYKYLNNILPDGVYYKSFCLYPEETQPSGTINLRQIKGKQYKVDFNKNFLIEHLNLLKTLYKSTNIITSKNSITLKFISKNYDLFVVHKGEAKLLFNI